MLWPMWVITANMTSVLGNMIIGQADACDHGHLKGARTADKNSYRIIKVHRSTL